MTPAGRSQNKVPVRHVTDGYMNEYKQTARRIRMHGDGGTRVRVLPRVSTIHAGYPPKAKLDCDGSKAN
jgi:hypothetical protein